MRHQVIEQVTFGCQNCGNTKLTSDGAVKTDQNLVYFLYTCPKCEHQVPISLYGVMMELCSPAVVH